MRALLAHLLAATGATLARASEWVAEDGIIVVVRSDAKGVARVRCGNKTSSSSSSAWKCSASREDDATCAGIVTRPGKKHDPAFACPPASVRLSASSLTHRHRLQLATLSRLLQLSSRHFACTPPTRRLFSSRKHHRCGARIHLHLHIFISHLSCSSE